MLSLNSVEDPSVPPPSPRRAGGAGVRTIAVVLLVIGLAAAMSVDVVKTGQGVKSDEATYVAMTLSLAYDHDLTYQRRDLERYVALYRWGPDGIFLKRGKQLHLHVNGTAPYIHLGRIPDTHTDRLYFGKALIYPLVAAPFVRLLGLNGFLVLNVLLLFAACVCGYVFLAVQSRPGSALAFTLAFVFASCVPIYLVFLTPEIFNFSLVFLAYFLWLYKEVAPPVDGARFGFLRGIGSDICAALLIGAATYSKASHALLIVPIVLWMWWRRRPAHGLLAGALAVAMAGALFFATALNSGEFNYQGGDRKTFLGHYPFDGAQNNAWESQGLEKSTNDSDADNVFTDFPNRFSHNVEYFLVGRHFGFVPYFFPGVIAIGLWLLSRERFRPWRLLTFFAVTASAAALLVFFPFTWSGGGGPPGNRYFMSLYPALFFLTPPLRGMAPAVLAFAGGVLFTVKILVNPFMVAKHPIQLVERGLARRLPVELTMWQDLPVMLESQRGRMPYGDLLLYFMDDHAYAPEVVDKEEHRGVWIAADGRADILVRSDGPVHHFSMIAESPVRTQFIVSAGGSESRIPLEPGKPVTIDVPAVSVRGDRSYATLLSARSTEGFSPYLRDPQSGDRRNLGVLMRFTAVQAPR